MIFKKENGAIRILNVDVESIPELKAGNVNPCFTCDNARSDKCSKIADGKKKNILKYDYITDGYQVYNENGELQNLIVSKCMRYVEDHPREKITTREQIEELRRLRESLKILFFDGVDAKEADRIQEDQRRRGLLVDYNPFLTKGIK